MQDTPEHILHIQREIFAAKTPSERFMIGIELMEGARKQIEGNIRQNNPGISALNLKIELFKRLYSNDFNQEEMQKIIESFIEFDKNQV